MIHLHGIGIGEGLVQSPGKEGSACSHLSPTQQRQKLANSPQTLVTPASTLGCVVQSPEIATQLFVLGGVPADPITQRCAPPFYKSG
jgi:hypothetical protein